jgi:L-seryl-tRNA(Ser) seleniumtransferase
MRVHCSNFRTVGFTEEVSIEELCALGRQRRLMVIDDIGSGAIGRSTDRVAAVFREEPSVRRSIASGSDLVCFSGDKLLGGPQAGVVAGRREPIEKMKAHPLARALRIDKLSLAALEATLLVHRDPELAAADLPILRTLTASEEELQSRAKRLCDALRALDGNACVSIDRDSGRVGGGALPLLELEGPVVKVKPSDAGLDRMQASLRANDPPVVARSSKGLLVLDPRTIADSEIEPAAAAVAAALR